MIWHKISEKLPPIDKDLLFYHKETNSFLAGYNDGKDIWYVDDCYVSLYVFSHWAELEPPEDSKDD